MVKYRIKTDKLNADDIKNIQSSSLNTEKGKITKKLGAYGIFIGIAYGIVARKNIISSMIIGALAGSIIGVVLDNKKNK